MWQRLFTQRARKQGGQNQRCGYNHQRSTTMTHFLHPLKTLSPSPSNSPSWGTIVWRINFWDSSDVNHDYTNTIMQVAWKPCSGHVFTSPQMTGFIWAWCVILLQQYDARGGIGSPFFLFYFPKYFESGAQGCFIWSEICSQVLKDNLRGSQRLYSDR